MADGEWNLTAIEEQVDPRASHWKRCKPWIEAALERGGGLYDIEHVERMVNSGEAYFSYGARCAAVVTIIGTRKKALNFWLLGGDLKELVNHMRPVIEAWAKLQGCEMVLGVFGKGRKGWERVLEPHGYHYLSTALVKEL